MEKIKLLFVCIHNSARSQMAEGIINHFYSSIFTAESAGIEAGKLNPFAVKAMELLGIDISGNQTDDVNDFLRQGRKYDFIITVCDESNAERCPVFPGPASRLHWGFPDPSSFKGNDDEKLKFTIAVRNQIQEKIDEWVKSF